MIRLATPMDLDAVFELAVLMRQETHWKDVRFEPNREAVVCWLLVTLSTSPQHVLYVAEEEQRIVGFCLGVLTNHPFVPDVPFVAEQGWFVEPEYRRGHVGMALWKRVVDWARLRGAKASIYSKPILTNSNGKPHPTEVHMWQNLE
jgi:GNAT superfamily N-acetyltransferase